MAFTTPKPIHSLVIDAGPIIRNEPSISTLLGQAEALFTVPAIIDEIRDAVTRSRVQTTLLPFLTLRSPKVASIKAIQDFARKTGDLEVLSRPDVHLMALAYELECERNHGDWRLRSEPGQKGLNGKSPSALALESSVAVLAAQDQLSSATKPADDTSMPNIGGAWESSIAEPSTSVSENKKSGGGQQAMLSNHLPLGDSQSSIQARLDSPSPHSDIAKSDARQPIEKITDTAEAADISYESDEDEAGSDDQAWITPSNLKKHQQREISDPGSTQEEPKILQVAIITTDFSMQNVLLRMNINLLSTSLRRVQQLKMWVLRCHACFHVTKDMTKQFCTRCGKPTLLRTACSIEKDGGFKVHLKKNMQWNNRGNIYSVPKPVAGTSNGKLTSGGGRGGWGQELILAEDQKEYVQAITGARKTKENDLMDEDYLPSILSGDRRTGGRVRIGAGKNVNARKRK